MWNIVDGVFLECYDEKKRGGIMGIIKDMKQSIELTEREKDIRDYILAHPEKISKMSSRELGATTFTSAASVTRFCQKLGCEGYQEFKLRFLSELRYANLEQEEVISIAPKENIAVIMTKLFDIQRKVLEETRQELTLEQMVRIGKILKEAEYIDFYVYDVNVSLAEYACNQFYYCGKVSHTYIATNTQELMALMGKSKHLAILISRTGENSRLIEIAKTLRKKKVPIIVITADKQRSLTQYGNEALYAATERGIEDLGTVMFSSSVKYILDIMFCMTFSEQYEENMKMNEAYEKIGRDKLWALLKEV